MTTSDQLDASGPAGTNSETTRDDSFLGKGLPWILGFVIVVPLFFDVGPGGIHLGRGIFEDRRAMTQTLPISVFAVMLISSAIALVWMARGRIRLPGPLLFWTLIAGFAWWFITLALGYAADSTEPILYAGQSLLPFVALLVTTQIIRSEHDAQRLIRGISTGFHLTVWGHLLSLTQDVAAVARGGFRMPTQAWGIEIYQAYSYYPLSLAIVLLLLTSWRLHTGMSARGFLAFILFTAAPGSVLILLLGAREPLATVFGGGILLLLLHGWRHPEKRVWAWTIPILLIGSAIAAIGIIRSSSELSSSLAAVRRIQEALTAADAGTASGYRVPILRDAWDVIQSRWYAPLLGTGLRSPTWAFAEARFPWPSAHNYYADLILWSGIPAFLLILSVLAVALQASWHVWLQSTTTSITTLALSGICTLILVLGLSNMVNVPLRQPFPSIIIWVIIGATLGAGASTGTRSRDNDGRACVPGGSHTKASSPAGRPST